MVSERSSYILSTNIILLFSFQSKIITIHFKDFPHLKEMLENWEQK
jgi:hypothetical protein